MPASSTTNAFHSLGAAWHTAALLLLPFWITADASAQTVHDEGLWSAVFANGTLHDSPCGEYKWWFDGHARFLDDADGFNQSIVRPGIGYAVTDSAAVWAGYGWIRTSPLGGAVDFDEHRLWQQLTWSTDCGPIQFALRPRLEQRFLDTGSDMGWRFRQQVRLWHRLPQSDHLSLVAWDEVFLNLNDTDYGAVSGLDQNRAFVGFGWTSGPDSSVRTEVGYLHQFIEGGAADRNNHILSINFFVQPRRR